MGGLVLDLEEQSVEGLPEGLPAGRAAEPAPLAEIEIGEAALRAEEDDAVATVSTSDGSSSSCIITASVLLF